MEDSIEKYADFQNSSVADWILHHLKLRAAEKGKIAQIFADDGSSWTYEHLLLNSVQVAAGLGRIGIVPGDMVSLIARNCHELYAVVLGCLMAGVTVAPSIAESKPSEMLENFLIVNPKFVIAGAPFIPAVQETVTLLDPKPQFFEIQQFFKDTTAKGTQVDPYTFQPVHIPDPKNHVFSCLFSSGTTGKPKAVSWTDYGMLRYWLLASRFQIQKPTGCVLNDSQMHWNTWWFGIGRNLLGLARMFMDKSTLVDILDAIHKLKPTFLTCGPHLVDCIVRETDENPGRWDLSSLRAIVIGGEICNVFAHERLSKKLKMPIFQSYGSTEAGVVLQSPFDSPVVYGSVGKPLVPLKLVDVTTGEEVTEPNKPGEVVVKRRIFRDYVNNLEATANAFDEKGWLKMGDIAVFDQSGNYFIVDRIKEMFRYLGKEVFPSQLETIIQKIPGVKDIGVAGKPAFDDKVGLIPTAFVVRSPGSELTEEDVYNYLKRENLLASKLLRGGVMFTEAIPRNANGKICRTKLKALLHQS